jgi:hypothetical protein
VSFLTSNRKEEADDIDVAETFFG